MRLLLNPYLLLALLVFVVAVGALGYKAGYRHAENACAADKAAALTRAIEQAAAIARQDAEVLGAHEQQLERTRTVFQTIREEVTRYVANHAGAADQCLDSDGLRLWRAANAGSAEAAAPPQPDYSLPGPAAATLGTRGGPAGQPRAGGGAVSRLPGKAPGLVGVGEE
ncbi:MAG: hypothetical protein Q8S32_17220 [Burkholderiaceae bacterium]|nr:hypothetical protein [Burkholderiaceae bacterium]